MSSSKSNHLPKAPSPNTFTLGVRSLRGTQFNLWLMTDQRNLNFLFSILENNSAIPFRSPYLIYEGLVFLPGEAQGRGSLGAAVCGVAQSRTRLKRLSSSTAILKLRGMSLLTGVHAKSLRLCPTLCNPTDCSPSGSSVPGIVQAKILEWVA